MLVLFAGCTQEKSSKQLLEERAESFSTAFFNYQFKGASVSVDDIMFVDPQETNADIRITVHNFLWHDSIGKPGRIIDEAQFMLKAYQEGSDWRIRMEGLPQSGK